MEADKSLKLIAYLEGDLNQQEREAVDEELRHNAVLRQEFDNLKSLYSLMSSEPEVQVPVEVSDDFHTLLKNEKRRVVKNNLWISWAGKAAAAITILAAGVWLGILYNANEQQDFDLTDLKEEIDTNRELLLQALNQPAASERIMAVNASNRIMAPDEEVVNALVEVMNTDDNTNVRLAAVRALSRYADDEKIRDALINSLLIQSDPLVQVFLIDILVELNENRIIPSLEKLIKTDTIMDVVKDEAQWGVMKLS